MKFRKLFLTLLLLSTTTLITLADNTAYYNKYQNAWANQTSGSNPTRYTYYSQSTSPSATRTTTGHTYYSQSTQPSRTNGSTVTQYNKYQAWSYNTRP